MTQPGDMLLHYRLLEPLGEGGGGVVWRSLDTRLGREVALKLLPERIASDPEALARFEDEARTVAALNHPNIVTLHSVEEADGVRFLTMELVKGRTLDQVIPEGGLPLETLLELAMPLVEAVADAHQHGVTHRDLKPRNVMVSSEGRVKVLDFGLARFRPAAVPIELSSAVTRTRSQGPIFGTLPYMSPEQVQGHSVGPSSDVFSLGIMLFEMATGWRPFAGDSPAELIAAILRDAPGLPARVPGGLALLIESCLEKDPRRRPQSALELRSALAALSLRDAEAASGARASVAVLPFADMSREQDQAYFCEGMAEEVIAALARVEGLRVVSRTSSFLFRGSGLDSREIGRRLQVGALVEGSVRKAGGRLRITAELTDVTTGYHLWSQRYDRLLADVFAVQEEIATSIVGALRLTLSPSERSAPRRAPTRDLQAYDYYLRGRQYYFHYNRRGMGFALEMYAHAIQLDPGYARAYAGIANCNAFLYIYAERSEAIRERADEASRKALALDPQLAEAHASRGATLSAAGRATEAEAAFESALRLDPALYEAHYLYARHAFAKGELERAAREFERAGAARPDDYQVPLLVAQVYARLGREAEAAAVRRRGLVLAEAQLRLNPDDARARYLGANALVALGERERGLEWARAARSLEPGEPMLLYNLGCIHALAGDPQEALDCLEAAVRAGLTERGWYEQDGDLAALRGHPRFRALVESMT